MQPSEAVGEGLLKEQGNGVEKERSKLEQGSMATEAVVGDVKVNPEFSLDHFWWKA